MYSKSLCIVTCCLVFAAVLLYSCSPARQAGRIVSSADGLKLELPSEAEMEQKRQDVVGSVTEAAPQSSGGPTIMNAIRDDETGEMVATDVITASRVEARFRHVAERFGRLSIEFDIRVPSGMTDSRWQLRFNPVIIMMGDSLRIEPLLITGQKYRESQLRGYQRYNNFLSSIIDDSLAFIYREQLECFLKRNFPDTYSMKNDSTVVSDHMAESLFGVTQRDALEHYKKRLLMLHNGRRRSKVPEMRNRYIKDPIADAGIRLDTVISGDSDIVYRYVQELQSRPGLRRIDVAVSGSAWEYGRKICELPQPTGLTFYVSSLSSLADGTCRYLTRVVERSAYDRTFALIDFEQGSSVIDSSLSCNASELRRVSKSISAALSNPDYMLDSLVVSASCSPEGSYSKNKQLSGSRAESMCRLLSDEWVEIANLFTARCIPEDWGRLRRLIISDTLIDEKGKTALLDIVDGDGDPDIRERRLAQRREYRYLREKIYPQLRCVQVEFYSHRPGMVKDTVHTTEPDKLYISGVKALQELDYETAVGILRPYRDYNAALALVSMSYNNSALDILDSLDSGNAKVWYLRAIALSRLERYDEAYEAWRRSVELDGGMLHRGNLDPEISELSRRGYEF